MLYISVSFLYHTIAKLTETEIAPEEHLLNNVSEVLLEVLDVLSGRPHSTASVGSPGSPRSPQVLEVHGSPLEVLWKSRSLNTKL